MVAKSSVSANRTFTKFNGIGAEMGKPNWYVRNVAKRKHCLLTMIFPRKAIIRRINMKPEEAIKILKERIELTKKVWSNVPEIIEYREALELAVKALQIQIPMKPDNIKSILDFSGKYYTSKGDCPVCTRKGLYKSDFWCNKCGQKLDWSEENGR